jgi:ABC-type glycerol-3-phosphate transport system permease component
MLVIRLPGWARGLCYLVISILVVVYILPYLWMIMSSFRASTDPFAMGVFPKTWTVMNYVKIFQNKEFMLSFSNSFIVAFSAAFLALVLGIPAGYGFARFHFRGREMMMGFLIVIRTFPGILLAIALFIMAVKFKLYDTHIPLILANTLLNLPFTIWNLRTVFESTSHEIEEAAMVEGCNRLQALIKIVLPITLPGLASTFAFVFILSWNEYMFATTFISSAEKRLISTTMASAIGQFNVNYSMLIPAAILSTIPMILLFMLIQRYIISGLSLGGVKG